MSVRKGGDSVGNRRRAALAVFLASALFAAAAGPAAAGLPAPAWMPNAPIMAGPQVILLWLPVPGAVKYNVYVNDKKVAEAVGVQHMIATPEEAGEYNIRVAGVDGSGAEGAKSTAGVIRIILIEPPHSIMTRVTEGKVTLRWDKAKGAVVYNVYRAEKKDGNYKLIGSVQGENYTDGDAAKGKTYYYAITAKDLSGKESKRSEVFTVSLVEEVRVEEAKVTFKAVPTDETARVGFIDGKRVMGLSDLKLEKASRELWIVIEKKIYRMNLQGEIVGQIGPVEDVERFIKFDFGPDGNLYLSDMRGFLYCLGRDGAVRWKVKAPKPPLDDAAIWEGIPPQIKANYGPTGGDILCLDGEVWMTDQMFAVVYVFDYTGKFKRYISKYTDSKGKAERFSAVGEIDRLKDGRIIVTFPLAHYASVTDKDLKESFAIGKAGSGFIGKFIGIAGAVETPDGNLLLTDPGVNSIQVFDGKTGAYLYHIGGGVAKEDPGQPGRAFLEFGSVAYAVFLDAQNLVVYTGSEQAILFLKLKK